MASGIDARFGLKPVRHITGAPWNGLVEKCWIDADYAVALFIGDAVQLQTETDYQDPFAKYKSIMKCGAGDSEPIGGVIVAFDANPNGLETVYAPAAYEGYAFVVTDPSVIFEIRDCGTTTPTKLWVGQNASLVFDHAGDTTTGISGMELDSDTPAANDSLQLFIHNLSRYENNLLEARAIWDVQINIHQLARTSTGDGTDVGILGVTAT